MPLPVPCPRCGKVPPPPCSCPPAPPAEKPKLRPETIRMRREKRGGGREVVILEGFPKGGFDLEALARDLKRALGAGGTVRGFEIEIHGDHRDRLAELLLARGFRSRRAGG